MIIKTKLNNKSPNPPQKPNPIHSLTFSFVSSLKKKNISATINININNKSPNLKKKPSV